MSAAVHLFEFLRDFIVGDAWEIAAGLAVTLVALGILAHLWHGSELLGFVLVAVVIALTGWSLARVGK